MSSGNGGLACGFDFAVVDKTSLLAYDSFSQRPSTKEGLVVLVKMEINEC